MKTYPGHIIISIIMLCCMTLFAGMTRAEQHVSLQGLNSIKAVFDFRTGNPQLAGIYLSLIHNTYRDKYINAVAKKPDFIIVFGGQSLRFVSSSHKGYSKADAGALAQLTAKLSEMARDGISLEFCKYGASLLNVIPASEVAGITYVDNGWKSLIGYQARGYSFMAAF